jgi:hypothetical protein
MLRSGLPEPVAGQAGSRGRVGSTGRLCTIVSPHPAASALTRTNHPMEELCLHVRLGYICSFTLVGTVGGSGGLTSFRVGRMRLL